MKIALVLLCLFPLLAEASNYSSNQKYFGVGGWGSGKSCPGIELIWVNEKLSFKTKKGKKIDLPAGMAKFSPDCKYFWQAGYSHEAYNVYNAEGVRIARVEGRYPEWAQDSKGIYSVQDFTPAKLKYWELAANKNNFIFTIKDNVRCLTPGDGLDWRPVELADAGFLKWRYRIAGKATARGTFPARTIWLDERTRALVRQEPSEMECN